MPVYVIATAASLSFLVSLVVIKNQFLHVYAKNYEGNGQMILIRIIRYSLDGECSFSLGQKRIITVM